jgi:hypothetical protein
MKRIFFVLVAAILLLVSNNTSAQIKGLLRDKAFEALQNKNKKEEEQKKQEEEQKKQEEPQQQEQPTQQRQKPGSNIMQQKMMGAMGLNNVKFETQYDFTSSMAMEIESIDSVKNKENVLYTTYFNPSDKSFAMVFDAIDRETGEKQKSTIIFDTKNWAMLILSEKNGERSGIAMKVDPDSTLAKSETTETVEQPVEFVHPYYKATGRSKSVAGYTCKEFEYSNPEGSVSVWATNDQKLNFSNAYGYMNGFQAMATAGWGWGMGMVMEMVFKDADSPARTHMLVKEILPNSAKRINIAGFNVVGFGGS